MRDYVSILCLLCLCIPRIWSQGEIEAVKVQADSLIGDGSRITGITPQNLAVSVSGDTLYITEGNYVIIPGLSASNSGTAYANAGPDIINACQTSFNLQGSEVPNGATGTWSIISGTGGSLVNKNHPNALFIGQEGESYLLQWTIQYPGGSSSFDQLNVSIAMNTQTSVANAGQDLFAIMTQTITLNGNYPDPNSAGRWMILQGIGGIIFDFEDPQTMFSGLPGESYTLRWQHYNVCSTSTDELILTFNEAAAGVPSSHGRYYIPDPKFRQYLQIAYPSVMDGDSLIIAMGPQVNKVVINELNVSNLDGLQYLTDIVILEANRNYYLTAIPHFSQTLVKLSCNDCISLKIVPEFPANLDTLDASGWNVSTMPILPNNLKYLRIIDFEILNSFQNLPSNLRFLELRHSSLNLIPNLPQNLEYFSAINLSHITSIPIIPESCQSVELSSLGHSNELLIIESVNIPSNARDFRLRNTKISGFPALPIDRTNLEILVVTGTDVSSMPSLYSFTNLSSINLSDNSLLKLDSIPFITQSLDIHGNPIICVENKPPLVEDQLSQYEICPPQN